MSDFKIFDFGTIGESPKSDNYKNEYLVPEIFGIRNPFTNIFLDARFP